MRIKELAKKYNLGKNDFWELKRGQKSMWIITHDAIEKIAIIENIELTKFEVLNTEVDFARFLITMQKGDKTIVSVGEASTKNCTSNYYGCMAEKRGIDRCVLKLISAYEYNIYSDVEADAFKQTN
tara:strand:- start:844 stop:1221 length:378 start_codon:yes stop_codon:yes gene_type:complete